MESEIERSLTTCLNTLEARVKALESGTESIIEGSNESLSDSSHGTVTYQGNATIGSATYEYSWARPSDSIVESSWDQVMEHLSATAHPVRGRILKYLLSRPTTAAELVENNIVSSTGTAYHHLSALQSAGWIQKSSQGHHEIKPKRVIALLAIILAMEESS